MSAGSRPIVGLLIWAAYFVIPTDAGGLIDGLPLGPLDATALIGSPGWRSYGGRLPLAPLAAVAMIVTPPRQRDPGTGGFRARYFTTLNATGAHERSSQFSDSAFTRIDDRLHFTPGGPELPLDFFNDNNRFTISSPAGERNLLEFAVRWSGLWWVRAAPARSTWTRQRPAKSSSMAVSAMRAPASPLESLPGWHRLDVEFSSPFAAPRRFSAGTLRRRA